MKDHRGMMTLEVCILLPGLFMIILLLYQAGVYQYNQLACKSCVEKFLAPKDEINQEEDGDLEEKILEVTLGVDWVSVTIEEDLGFFENSKLKVSTEGWEKEYTYHERSPVDELQFEKIIFDGMGGLDGD